MSDPISGEPIAPPPAPGVAEATFRRQMLAIFALIGVPVLTIFAVLDVFQGRYVVAALVTAMAGGCVGAWAWTRRSPHPARVDAAVRWFGRIYGLLFAGFVAYSLGVEGLATRLPWVIVFPVLICFTLPLAEAVVWMVSFAVVVAGALGTGRVEPELPPALLARFAMAYGVLTACLALFSHLQRRNRRRIREANRRLRQAVDALTTERWEREEAEAALASARQSLDARVRERTRGLAQMNEQLNREVDSGRRAERELRRSEGRLRAIFEHSPDAIFIHTLGGKFLEVNRAAEDLLGYTRDELVGKSLLHMGLLSPGDAPRASGGLLANSKGEVHGPEIYGATCRDGTRVDVEISADPIRLDGERVVLTVVRRVVAHPHEGVQSGPESSRVH